MKTLLVAVLTLLAARPALAERMTFAWPVPAKVVVTDKVSQRETSATLRYEVTLTRTADGKALALKMGKFEFLEFQGRDARDPAVRKQLRPTLEIASAMPTILVSPQGSFLDLMDVEALGGRIARSSAIPPKERSALVKAMKSPAMLASMKARSVELWNVWVGFWAGADLEPGRTRELKLQTPLPDGQSIERPVSVTHNGPAGPPGNVHLVFRSTMEVGPKQAAMRALQDSARALAAKDADAEIEGMVLSTGGEVITDPATLKPAAARSTRDTRVKLKGQPPRAEFEVHEYTFDWTMAKAPAQGK